MGDSERKSGQLKAQKRSGRERQESLQESAFLLLLDSKTHEKLMSQQEKGEPCNMAITRKISRF